MKTWSVKATTNTLAHTYPGNGKTTIKLIMEEGTNRIVGGQIAGSKTSAKRIDVIAALIHMNATPIDMAKLDLAYAPPFAPVWDPLLVAANVAVSKIKQE
jgi:NADPH-dependent 2,4-dienoyl-CoA reductase/sulfur reductase-like enzyme